MQNKLIKSISYDQSEIIKWILKLHVPDGRIDCDPTYSIGNFYKNNCIAEPMYKFDINPQCDDVVCADSRNLPLGDSSINYIMFDPPFLATTGKSLYENKENNIINQKMNYIGFMLIV